MTTSSFQYKGVRGGAATVFYPLWHREAESLLVLKNNRGVEDNRARHMDYGVQLNKTMYQRLIKGGNISLFSPNEVPGLLEAFYSDQDEFDRLYTKYEADESIQRITVKAVDLFSILMQERASTGRIYIQNVDHCNTHSAFNPKYAPVTQSNLCMEICLPTKPMTSLDFSDGEIALCILSGVNMGVIEKPEDMEEPCELLVRALDAIIDYQEYPVKPAEYSCTKRRMLGIGVINHAYFLAKNRTRYSDEASKELTHMYFEALQYYCLKASVKLAKEYGPCELYHETTYAQGLLPIDTYKKDVDSICDIPYYFDWEELRDEIKEHGLRNSCLTSQFPSETSSQISNATNGIEPPRGYVSIKASKDGILKQVVPEYEKYGAEYELLWDMPSNKGYLENVAVMQKFMDQSISTNTNYDPKKYPDGKVPMKVLLQDLLMAYKLGVKTLYYQNTRDGADDKQGDLDDGCAGGGCKL